MSAKTDFINAKIIKLTFDYAVTTNESECDSSDYYEAMIREWCCQLVLAELEEWQDGSTPGFKYDNN